MNAKFHWHYISVWSIVSLQKLRFEKNIGNIRLTFYEWGEKSLIWYTHTEVGI